ncbi:tectonic-3 [Pelobates fuscus]|uniref:tectonic-3 n=1 Tax=Pelobates fuscus TaxID=191477 RepID=UPI002FE4F096
MCSVLPLLLLGAVLALKVRAVTGASGDVVICTCDLTPGICDINCCCDPDCTSTDATSVFSYCLPGSNKVHIQVCLYNWLIFRSNTPYSTVLVTSSSVPRTPDLFCVLPGDSTLNYFVTPQTVNETNFSSLSETYKGFSFSPVSLPVPTFTSFYKAGDPILTLSAPGVLGVLRQPAPVGAQIFCSDTNPARFLQNGTTSCMRIISDLNTSCLSDRALSASSYYQNISVLRVPTDAANKTALNVEVTGLVPESPALRGNSCDNVVSQVIYTVVYNGTQGIQNVSVSFILLNVTSSQLLTQSFTGLYKSASATSVSSVTRSGNPGYLTGLPVLTDSGSLSLLTLQGDGSCSHSPVQFGVNSVSGCPITVGDNETCSDLRARAYNLLLGGSLPQRVATFGNATVTQNADWTSIIYQNCSTQNDVNCTTGCLVPVYLHVQILWVEVGLLSNPEAQVQGARFKYSCQSVKCRDVVMLHTQASFTDITRRGPAPRSQPSITDREPLDFFFPFQTNGAVQTCALVQLILCITSLCLCL